MEDSPATEHSDLKRHRDDVSEQSRLGAHLMITNLAAQAYAVVHPSAVSNIVERMPHYVNHEARPTRPSGKTMPISGR